MNKPKNNVIYTGIIGGTIAAGFCLFGREGHNPGEMNLPGIKPATKSEGRRDSAAKVRFSPGMEDSEMDEETRRLVESGVSTKPVKVDADAPVGTTFVLDQASYEAARKASPDGNTIGMPGAAIGRGLQTSKDLYEEKMAALRKFSADEYAASPERRRVLQERAAALGVPLTLNRESALIAITEDDEPVYISGANISGADTIGVDQLWPSGTAGYWSDPGNTGLNLDGSGQTIAMWEALGGIRATHDQFGGRAAQLDYDLPAEESHPTSTAGTIASAGLPFLLVGSVELGAWSRGVAYEAALGAYDSYDYSAEVSAEAGNGLRFANNSIATDSGWKYDTSVSSWRWYGSGAATQDWKFGAYLSVGSTVTPKTMDDISYAAPYTALVYAAGNDNSEGPGASIPSYYLGAGGTTSSVARDWADGDDGGYDSLPSSACAKNTISVGSIESLEGGWASASAVTLSPFSAMGPTDDGRLKPEVVAQGSRANGATARNPNNWQNVTTGFNTAAPDDATYTLNKGTSVASASVSGVLALINQRRTQARGIYADDFTSVPIDCNWTDHPVRSSGFRALLAHTADEAGANPGPDYKFGYGVVNAVRAVQLIADDALSGPGTTKYNGPKPYYKEVLLKANETVEFKVSRIDASTPIKVTLAWTDPSGTAQTNNTVDQQNARLVNDLDVRVYPPGVTPGSSTKNAVTTGRPWTLTPDLTTQSAVTRASAAAPGDDSRNNLEQVVIDSPVTGDYTVVLDHKGTSLSSGSQWATLVVSGNTVPAVTTGNIAFTSIGSGMWSFSWHTVVGGLYVVEWAPYPWGPWAPISGEICATRNVTTELVTPPAGASTYYFRTSRTY
jgi:hypothetical protein